MFDPPTRGIRLERSRKKRPYYREKLLWCHQKTNNRMQPLTINFQLALSINIDAYGWLLTNSVIQIHMTIFQHLLHQNMNVVVLFISYPTIPSSLIKFGANYWFVNGQPYASIFIESAISKWWRNYTKTMEIVLRLHGYQENPREDQRF